MYTIKLSLISIAPKHAVARVECVPASFLIRFRYCWFIMKRRVFGGRFLISVKTVCRKLTDEKKTSKNDFNASCCILPLKNRRLSSQEVVQRARDAGGTFDHILTISRFLIVDFSIFASAIPPVPQWRYRGFGEGAHATLRVHNKATIE